MTFIFFLTTVAGLNVGVWEATPDWKQIANSGTARLYVDPASIKGVGPEMKAAWFRWVYDPPEDRVHYELSLERVDCSTESSTTMSTVYYDHKGEIVGQHVFSTPSWDPAPPGTVGGAMVRALCTDAR